MATREEIREGINKILKQPLQTPYMGSAEETIASGLENQVGEILSYLHSQGVVIGVDRELPTDTSQAELKRLMHIKIDALENGYVAVEPLIEGG